MAEWCMAHPWLTFWMVCLGLLVIDSAFTNVCRLVNNIIRWRMYKAGPEAGEEKEGGEGDG